MINSLTRTTRTKRLTIDGTNYILAAGTSDVESGSMDTQGFEGVRFTLGLGAMAASSDVEIQLQGSDDDVTFVDLTGTSQVAGAADDNKLIIAELIQPRHRYNRMQIIRGAGGNSTIDYLQAELFGARVEPVTKDATVLVQEVALSPAAGTA